MKTGRARVLMGRGGRWLMLAMAAVVAVVGILATFVHADDLNISPGASSGAELVQIVVPEAHRLIDFSADNLPGSGTEGDLYVTYNAGFDISVKLFGEGRLTIRDQNGNVLATYDKTTVGLETITLPVELLDGIGDYILTAEFSNPLDDSEVYGVVTIRVRWEAVVGPVLSAPLDVPSTGYYYFVGYAVAQSSFWACVTGISVTAIVVYFVVKWRRAKKSVSLSARGRKKTKGRTSK